MDAFVVYWLSLKEMDTATRVQILYKTDCISRRIYTLRKSMNRLNLQLAMSK